MSYFLRNNGSQARVQFGWKFMAKLPRNSPLRFDSQGVDRRSWVLLNRFTKTVIRS